MTVQTTQAPTFINGSLAKQVWCLVTGLVLAHTTYVFAKAFPQTDLYNQQDPATQGAFKVITLMAQGGGLGAFVFSLYWIVKNHHELPEREFDYGSRHYIIQVTAALAVPVALLTMTLLGLWITEDVISLS